MEPFIHLIKILNNINFELIYWPGSGNKVADALSRQGQDERNTTQEETIILNNYLSNFNV